MNDKKLAIGDVNYPGKIKEVVKDYTDLYYEGNIELLERNAIAVVGSRKCTAYGISVASEIVRKAVKRGFVIISGLAGGIDSIAHRVCLEEGGDAIAVIANGLDIVYPKRNQDLYTEIKKRGLLLSEYPRGTIAMKHHFPVRNRLISALADVVCVVEAKTRSGSLITAECAIEQGRPVYAVPGNITSVYSMGTNKLIRDGCMALAVIEDLFQGFSLSSSASLDENLVMGDDERKIYDIVSIRGESSISEIAVKTLMDINLINSIVTVMEMKGLVFCEMGKVILANFT